MCLAAFIFLSPLPNPAMQEWIQLDGELGNNLDFWLISCIIPAIAPLHSCDLHTSQSHFLITSETESQLQVFFPPEIRNWDSVWSLLWFMTEFWKVLACFLMVFFFSPDAHMDLTLVQFWLDYLCTLTPENLSVIQEDAEMNINCENNGADWRTRENWHELKQERFWLGIRINISRMRTVKELKRLLRETVQ